MMGMGLGRRDVRAVAAVALLLVVAGSSACRVSMRRSSHRPAPQKPAPPASQAGPKAGPPAPPPPQVAAVDLRARQDFVASLASPGVGLTEQASASEVTLLALENTARDEARGLRADPEAWTAVLSNGQRALRPVSLAAGECITFIAHGGLGVVELDLFVTSRGTSEVLAEDQQPGPVAVIGGLRRGRCFSGSGAPLQVDLHVRVRRGGGPVVVRAFRQR